MCVIKLLCVLAFIKAGYTAGNLDCCQSVEEGQCSNVCAQLSPSVSQAEQMSQLAGAATYCPHTMTSFWECAGNSLSVMRELDEFYGRPCCNLSKSRLCQEACSKAGSISDLDHHCSRSTEDTLYACLDRQKDGEKCCGKADSPDSSNCVTTCWDMYLSDTIAIPVNKRQLRQHCTGRNKAVYHCVQKQTKTTRTVSHSDNVHCCARTQNATCRSVCEHVLQSDDKDGRIIDLLIDACGSVDLLNPLYNCIMKFLRSSTHGSQRDADVLEIDAAKLHCCGQATSKSCGSLCVKTYNRRWSSFVEKFQATCGYMSSPISSMQSRLHGCLKEVEEPCQLGCSGLPYCTIMNNRPTEYFRSCTRDADTAAREDVLLWQQGLIKLPSLEISVKDISTCEPEMWKAIACVYQIMPCTKTPSPPQICMEDCMYILNKCVDESRLEGKLVRDFCKRLPPTGSDNCISVKQYTASSPHVSRHLSEISQPCKSNLCDANEYCHIHRRKCKPSKTCPHYVCRKGCKMGQVSEVLVPQNSNLLVPVYDTERVDQCQQYKVCHCNNHGALGHCRDMDCIPNQHCIISSGIVKSHGEYLRADCNDCVCFAGELVCTRRDCNVGGTDVSQTPLTGIKGCSCPRVYEPVCAINGKTYPSACIAECVGHTVYQEGSCFSLDPCKQNPCQEGFMCVVHRKVCYGHRNIPCDRYKCVSATGDCNDHDHDPVCDTRGEEFTNICLLLSRQRTLAYIGHCQVNGCSLSGLVCGHSGETYIHECAALAGRTTVDYAGPCRAFGIVTPDVEIPNIFTGIDCLPVTPSTCKGITPPWSICKVCTAELRVLTSDYLAGMVASTVNKGPLTIDGVLATLSDMITVAECDVFGYLGVDGDIVILVAPVTSNPTSMQVQACIKEAERFEYLILSRSPTFTSHMLLTPMLYAPLRTSKLSGTSAGFSVHQSYAAVTIVLLTHFTHKILGYV